MNLLDILFPKRCVGCGNVGRYFCELCTVRIRVFESNEYICPVCEKPAIDGITHPRCGKKYSPDGLSSYFRYDGIIRKAIKSIKYRFVSDHAKEFIDIIPSAALATHHTLQTTPCSLIPIPLHSSRLRERGFNQAEVLGKYIAKRLNVPMRTDILHRTKKTLPQVETKHRSERLNNMKDVFSVHSSRFTIQHPDVILFDDVFTTGTTMRSAAYTLKHAGVKHVWAVTLAR
jgi:competence protein ComFC